jgi:transcriptional regulator with XRE-family HTH domain
MQEDSAAHESLGQRIARLRRGRGWTQRKLADETGFRLSAVTKLERDSRTLHLEELTVLAKALEVSLDSLVSGSGRRANFPDQRLRLRLELLQELPKEGRDSLVQLLDAILNLHRLVSGRKTDDNKSEPRL